MNEFDCPMCEETCAVEWEDLPDRAVDSTEYECEHCGLEMQIGWVAEVEVRSVIVEPGRVIFRREQSDEQA